MIKFFRNIRQRLLSEGKAGKYLKYAIGEIILVVFGILIALQINNWNEYRKDQREQHFILNKLQSDIESDIETIGIRNGAISSEIDRYIICLEILGGQKDMSKREFIENFSGILGTIGFDQNATTFDNLVSSGKLELITNRTLSNAIVKYYTEDYKMWDTGLRDYTRNVIGPYLYRFDHVPQLSEVEYDSEYTNDVRFYEADISSFDVKPKTMEDYRNDLFIINAIRQKLYSYQGQLGAYLYLSKRMEQLVKQIEQEKGKLKN